MPFFFRLDKLYASESSANNEKSSSTSSVMMNAINSMLYPTISLKFSLHDKIKVSINKKNRSQLSNIRCLQNFYQEKKASPDYLTIKDKNSTFNKRATENSVWVAKFNLDGDFLATGGSDAILRVYEINKDIDNCTVI